MSGELESTPHDGHHQALDPENDWRSGSGIAGAAERYVSYGNFAGPGNRISAEHSADVAAQRAANPHYDEVTDPKYASDPRYQPIDGIDAAAQAHDSGYERHSVPGRDPFFSWEGMKAVHGDDRKLVSDVGTEMDDHGGAYSQTAKNYSEGLRGFFGARVAGVDAADWAGAKAAEAGSGIGSFVGGAKDWHSLGDAGHGIAGGVSKAGHWLADTAGEAWDGAAGAAKTVGGLGWPGAVGAAAGFGDVALAGGRSLAGAAWDGVKSAGAKAWSWLGGE